MIGGFKSAVARSVPFDNTTNGFPLGSTDVQTAIESVLFYDPLYAPATLFDDFDGRMAWSPSTAGTGAVASVSAGNSTLASGSHVGVSGMTYGTVGVPSHAALVWSGALSISIVLGNGPAEYESLIRISNLATVTEDYVLRVGLGTATNADHANGVYFEYNRSLSANWRCKSASQSSRTVLTTSTTVAATTWIRLGWTCNSAGTSVEFFINGVSQGTITTNIPTVTGQGCGGSFQIVASAIVSGGRTLNADYFYFSKQYTSRT